MNTMILEGSIRSKELKIPVGCKRELSNLILRFSFVLLLAMFLLRMTEGAVVAHMDVSQFAGVLAQINEDRNRFLELPAKNNEEMRVAGSGLKFDVMSENDPAEGKSVGSNSYKTAVLSSGESKDGLAKNASKTLKALSQKKSDDLFFKYFGKKFDLDDKRYSRYDHYFEKYSRKYFGSKTDWRWFKVQAFVESSMRKSVSSRVGAVGVMQVMPGTFKHIQKSNSFFKNKSINSVEWNIAAGIYYNRILIKSLSKNAAPKKRLQLMFASYNAGLNRIVRSVDKDVLGVNDFLTVPRSFPRETREYLKKIDFLMTHYRGVSYQQSFAEFTNAA